MLNMAAPVCRSFLASVNQKLSFPVAACLSRSHTTHGCGQHHLCKTRHGSVHNLPSPPHRQPMNEAATVATPLVIPCRHKTWYTDKRISGNLGAVGIPEADPDVSLITDGEEGQELAEMVNTSVEKGEHGRLFAIVSLGGVQRKITVEDILMVNKEFPPSVGDRIRLEKVLMVGGKDFTLLGQPVLSRDQVRVEATVIEKTLSHNQVWSTYKRRKRYRVLKLFRDPHTMFVINSIEINPIPQEEIQSQ